jgi:hypothetical protein
MKPTAGIGAAAAPPPMSTEAQRLANLAKGRQTAARNRAAAKARAAQPVEEEFEEVDEQPQAQTPAPRAGLGVAAARKVQAVPGTVIGTNDRGRVIVVGRDGKPISRLGDRNIDKYAIPKDEMPAGWSYQWIAETVLNEPQTGAMMDFRQKQWSNVPQERHPTIPVRQGGLVLVERPIVLTEEARQEELQEARDQVRANVEQFTPGGGLQKTGAIRKGRPVSVSADGVPDPVVELE